MFQVITLQFHTSNWEQLALHKARAPYHQEAIIYHWHIQLPYQLILIIALPVVQNNYYDVYHIFNIRNDARDEVKKYLLKNEIISDIHYPVAPNKQEGFKHLFDEKSFPISELIHNTTLSLPVSYFHTIEEIEKIVTILNKF